MIHQSVFAAFSDLALVDEVTRLAGAERRATACLVAALAEFDARRLYLGEGCPSLFVYCTRVLHLSEYAAYGRIEAARAVRRFPVMLEMLRRGELTMTAVGLLAPHLTSGNHAAVLSRAVHRSKREVEELVAALRPRPDVKPFVRRQPSERSFAMHRASARLDLRPSEATPVPVANTALAPPPMNPCTSKPRDVVSPLAPERYRIQFTADRETVAMLRRAQDLSRHVTPTGDLAVIFNVR